MKINMYWSVYKNLEKDVLKLADYLLFTDNQLNVYSIFIADLIVRCAIEIEAISKDLYKNSNKISQTDASNNITDNLYFDTVCLKHLNDIWEISEKK